MITMTLLEYITREQYDTMTKFTQNHNGEGEQSQALALVEKERRPSPNICHAYLLAAIKE